MKVQSEAGQKLKSRLKKDGHLFNQNLVRVLNYLAAWIANLGVVPLFLLVAFLFAPMFFFFLALLFSVTHVLETILKLPYRSNSYNSLFNNFYKPYFLPSKSSCVKGIFLSTWSIIVLNLANAQVLEHDIILARGQVKEISFPKLAKFAVGNQQVITYRFNEKTKTMLIRAKSLGHTEIMVWNSDFSVETFQFFVISKIQEAKLLHLAEIISGLGLAPKIIVPHLRVTGSIKNMAQFKDYQSLLEKNSDILMDEAELENDLKNKIFSSVYAAFFEDYKDSIKCQSEFTRVSCSYSENEAPNESLKKYLTDKFKVQFIQKSNQQFLKNYKVKIKIIQLEQLDGEDLRLGLEQVSGSLGDFFKIPLEKIVQKNQVLLTQKKVRLSTLAEPQALVRSLTPVELQIGADIPFKSININNVSSTDWKFAGLKVKVTLENYADKLKINYETELTQPGSDQNGNGSISGNKEKSSVIIGLKSAMKIFQISLKTEGKTTDQLPYVNAIPILGEIFKSKSNQSNYKAITGIIEVEENEE